MPKRSNPFSDGPQQLKTHVGQMEVAQGVAGQSLLKKIQENTMKLLLDGARSFYTSCDDGQEKDDSCNMETMNNNTQTHKQANIASFSGGKADLSTSKPNKSIKVPLCRACVSDEVVVQCCFCEQPTCINCLRTCCGCSQDFCSLCAVVSYEAAVERAFCLNCSR